MINLLKNVTMLYDCQNIFKTILSHCFHLIPKLPKMKQILCSPLLRNTYIIVKFLRQLMEDLILG